jgi:hypothetical protein
MGGMMTDCERHRSILAAQPVFALRHLAELLGWRGLQLRHCTFDDGKLYWWYETTDLKFHLQINPHPQGQSAHYRATVIATRYGLALDAVGFHDFSLPSEDDVVLIAEKLMPVLCRRNFRNKEWRKRFAGITPAAIRRKCNSPG